MDLPAFLLNFEARGSMGSSFLHLKEVKKCFKSGTKEYVVLDTISASFSQKNSYAIQGASGAGKSTLIHILAGIDTPSSGAVFFDNQNFATMTTFDHEQFLQHKVGLLFQQPYLLKELTVLENVMLPALIAGKPYEISEAYARKLLEEVHLSTKKTEKPSTLSGGQQQRVALARALINKPVFLLADEPTGNLDQETGSVIVNLMVKLHHEWGMGIIVSTHDSYVAQAMEHRYHLQAGSLSLD